MSNIINTTTYTSKQNEDDSIILVDSKFYLIKNLYSTNFNTTINKILFEVHIL